jgi:maleate cis-trans isomerase
MPEPVAQSLRVGLIVPSSNTVMEPDFHRHLGPECIVSTTRI